VQESYGTECLHHYEVPANTLRVGVVVWIGSSSQEGYHCVNAVETCGSNPIPIHLYYEI